MILIVSTLHFSSTSPSRQCSMLDGLSKIRRIGGFVIFWMCGQCGRLISYVSLHGWLSIKGSHPRPSWQRLAFWMLYVLVVSNQRLSSISFGTARLPDNDGALLNINILTCFKASFIGGLHCLEMGDLLCVTYLLVCDTVYRFPHFLQIYGFAGLWHCLRILCYGSSGVNMCLITRGVLYQPLLLYGKMRYVTNC